VPDLRCFRAIQLKYPGATFDGSPNLPCSGHCRQQPKSAMQQSLSTAAQICHAAATVDSSPNLPCSSHCRQQPKFAMQQSPLMAAQICHEAVTFDGSPNLPWSGTLEKSAMKQTALSPPWSGHLGAVRHRAGCLETAMEQDALRPPWSRMP
jgi:hypothetical protein